MVAMGSKGDACASGDSLGQSDTGRCNSQEVQVMVADFY